MLQAIQFEISPYVNVKLDSSAGLNKLHIYFEVLFVARVEK